MYVLHEAENSNEVEYILWILVVNQNWKESKSKNFKQGFNHSTKSNSRYGIEGVGLAV